MSCADRALTGQKPLTGEFAEINAEIAERYGFEGAQL